MRDIFDLWLAGFLGVQQGYMEGWLSKSELGQKVSVVREALGALNDVALFQ